MKQSEAVSLNFPCPACGTVLTISQPEAIGPCPTCQSSIRIQLVTRVLTAMDEEKEPELGYDRRRFRPASRPSKSGLPRLNGPSDRA